ncbi:spore germination protein [Paenibacillus whitsoniae]|uniref:Spore germination protein n=1 Tax=Paenibacillus whitsoniae TaxID=2496558 RepID=A0A3S0BLM1_9BACL|nr:spore germination protein [Paenibacillus whitsoniae]RTE09419.1 spore germination protein [Paenibacillus whitsoniae]
MNNESAGSVSTDLETNIRLLTQQFQASEDLHTRAFHYKGHQGCLLYLVSCTDKMKLQSDILKPLLQAQEGRIIDVLPVLNLAVLFDFKAASAAMLQGQCAILLDHTAEIVVADVSASAEQAVTAPHNEQTIRGSQEGFVDEIGKNMQLIQKRLKTTRFLHRQFTLGQESPTIVRLLYIEDFADPAVIDKISERLLSHRDTMLKSPGQLMNRLEGSRLSLFPQLLLTERPDTTAAHLMEGRVVMLVDGSAFAVIMPATFFMFFQAADDFNERWWNGTVFRIFRMVSFMLGISMPSIYIAIVSKHFDILPIDLVFSLKASLENIPFSPLMEALFMTIVLDLLREAAIRLPQSIATTLSIVGGLVIGSEVVNANLVSTTMIVVISLTAVASFSVPSHEMRLAIRLISFPMMIAASLLGFTGIAFSFSFIFMHISKLETFGVPYFYPAAPFKPRRLLNAIVQLPGRVFGKRRPERGSS